LALVGLFRSRRALEAERPGAAPADQRPAADRAKKASHQQHRDRLILVGLYRLFPDVRGALAIAKPSGLHHQYAQNWPPQNRPDLIFDRDTGVALQRERGFIRAPGGLAMGGICERRNLLDCHALSCSGSQATALQNPSVGGMALALFKGAA